MPVTRVSRSILAFVILCLLCASCDSDDNGDDDDFSLVGTELSVAEIAGTWIATRALFGLAAAGPVVEVDVVAEGGSVRLDIRTDGTFTLTLTRAGGAPEVSTGRLGFDEDLLVVSFDDDPDDFEYFGIQATDTTMRLEGPVSFDVDGDGVEEAARVELELVRS